MSRSKLNHPKIKFACKDYNKRGGALGNIECAISGVIKEPLAPKPVVVEDSQKIPTEVVEQASQEVQSIPKVSVNKTRPTTVAPSDPFESFYSVKNILAIALITVIGHLGYRQILAWTKADPLQPEVLECS